MSPTSRMVSITSGIKGPQSHHVIAGDVSETQCDLVPASGINLVILKIRTQSVVQRLEPNVGVGTCEKPPLGRCPKETSPYECFFRSWISFGNPVAEQSQRVIRS